MRPPFSLTPKILNQVSMIERLIGQLESIDQPKPQPELRKSSRVKTLYGSLAIEGNTLDIDQITAILDGKKVIAPKDEITEILNANEVYERLTKFDVHNQKHLLKAHGIMMKGILSNAGKWRSGNVGIFKDSKISHMAPPAKNVPFLMDDLFTFLKSDTHPLIMGCVFHYEFEFIHPFKDGNGRIGRFWHSLLLFHYHQVFEYIPVESIIKKHQQAYYHALEKSDKAGNSTLFIEFSLGMILLSLEEFLAVFRPTKATAEDRLINAKAHFGTREFSRKEYLELHKKISTATASRDLKVGTDQGLLSMKGDRATSKYHFNR
jgi:Fic family protein